MVQAKDFDRKMLLLATQLAHDANLKSLLLTVLESLLAYLSSQKGFNNDVEALTMIRCVVNDFISQDLDKAELQMHHSPCD